MSSTEVSIFAGGLPAYLKTKDLDATTKALAGGGSGGKRISIRGGVFRVIVNGEQIAENEDRAMNVIVVAASPTISRTYYSGTYAEGQAEAPDCWSPDGVTPDATVKEPQASKCATCTQNISGSGQGESRACRFSQRIAVVLGNDPQGDVYQLSLASTSIFGKGENGAKLPLQAYARFLAANGAPIGSVVTEMKFDTSVATPKLTFRAIRALTEDEYDDAVEKGQSYDAVQAITMSVAQRDNVSTKEVTVGRKAVVEADDEFTSPPVEKPKKPKPVVVAVEVIAEPIVVKSKPTPAPTPVAGDIASVLAEWDDDED